MEMQSASYFCIYRFEYICDYCTGIMPSNAVFEYNIHSWKIMSRVSMREMLLTIFMLFRGEKSEAPQQTKLMTWRGDTGPGLSRAEDGQQQPAAERVTHPRVRGGLQQVRRDAVRPRVHQAARQPPQAPRHQPHQGGAAGEGVNRNQNSDNFAVLYYWLYNIYII